MPLFSSESEQDRQAREEQAARDAYLASPLGQAETAHKKGQMFFQFTAAVSQVEGHATNWDKSRGSRTRHFDAADTLGRIEALGWRLEHAGYVFVGTGEVSRGKVTSSGAVTSTSGYVQGIYLFRRVTR